MPSSGTPAVLHTERFYVAVLSLAESQRFACPAQVILAEEIDSRRSTAQLCRSS